MPWSRKCRPVDIDVQSKLELVGFSVASGPWQPSAAMREKVGSSPRSIIGPATSMLTPSTPMT